MEGVSLLLGGEVLMFGTCILVYGYGIRERAFYYILLITVETYVVSLTKIAYHYPRPYMISEEMKVYGCATEYGDPSGHTLSSSCIIVSVILDFWTEPIRDHNLNTFSQMRPLWQRLVLAIVGSIALIIVAFSRLYNGDHTLD